MVINLLRTYHFCNVVLGLDFLSYCKTDEHPQELDRLIRFNNAIQVSIARFLTFNPCEQGLTIHSSFQFPRMRRSIQRQNQPTTKANVLCQGSWFSQKLLKLDLQFSYSLILHCIQLLTKQDCRDRRKPDTDFMFAVLEGRK